MRGDDGRISEECENPHLATAGRTEKRQHSIAASEEYCPADACWAGRPGSSEVRPSGVGRGSRETRRELLDARDRIPAGP
jgi:hypothetical protein